MNTVFDYITSAVILGVVVLVVLILNKNYVNTFYQRNLDISAQDAAISILEIMESDFRRIGYMADSAAVADARENGITFYGDVDGDGTADRVTYAVGDSTELPATDNIHDRPLFRRVGASTPQNVASGLVRLSFSYRDINRTFLPYDSLVTADVRARIQFIDLDLRVEPGVVVDSTFAPVEVKRSIAPRNIAGW